MNVKQLQANPAGSAPFGPAEIAEAARDQEVVALIDAWAHHLTVVARLLTDTDGRYNQDIVVRTTKQSTINAPAYVANNIISLVARRIIGVFDATDKDTAGAVIKALVDHEVGHLLYSPTLGRNGLTEPIRRAWNILEDSRIENHLVARWPAMKAGLNFLVVRSFDGFEPSHDVRQQLEGLALTCSRYSVHPEFRAAMRSIQMSENAVEVKCIADEYIQLGNNDVQAMLRLATRLAELLYPHNDCKGSFASDHDAMQGSGGNGKTILEELAEVIADGQAEDQATKSAATTRTIGREVAKALAKARDEAVDAAQEDLQAVRAVERAGIANTGAGGEGSFHHSSAVHRPSSKTRAAATRLRTVIEREQRKAEPGLERHTTSGRLNVRRFAADAIRRDVFDRRMENVTDAVSIETIVVADLSGSMRPHVGRTAQALWTIKRASDQVGSKCTVYGFSSSDFGSIYDSDHKADRDGVPTLKVGGGTAPSNVLNHAVVALRRSTAAIRVLVVLTDGAWESPITSELAIAVANKVGITTVLFGIGAYSYEHESVRGPVDSYGAHQCQFAKDLRDVSELPDAVSAILRDRVTQALSRARH